MPYISTTTDPDERRYRIVRVPADSILDFFRVSMSEPPGAWVEPVLNGLPDGSEFLSINANWERQTIEFLVAHPTFDPVQEGSCPPEHPGMFRFVDSAKRRDDEV